MDSRGSDYVKVGIFVLLGLIVAGALIFIIGDERHMFAQKVHLYTSFRDVQGLRAGGPVRMGGVNVGSVSVVTFSSDPRDPTIHVEFDLVNDALTRVRRNSVAHIASKGLLGDKAIDITIGDPAQPQVANGSTIPGESTDEMGAAITNATQLLNRANTVMDNIVTATRPLANEQLGNDVVAMAHDLRTITNQIATGNGTMGRLLRDPEYADRIDGILNSAQGTMRDVQHTSAEVSALARDARTGHGLIHALVYDEQGARAIRSMSEAANEFAAITHDVRTGNGGMHNIIYGNAADEAIQNVNQATAGLRDIVRDVQHGRGTIGALLVDPSLYDDLKSLVGNVQRNEILRAMVRYSIHAEDRDAQGAVRAQDNGAGGGSSAQPGGAGGGSGSSESGGGGSSAQPGGTSP